MSKPLRCTACGYRSANAGFFHGEGAPACLACPAPAGRAPPSTGRRLLGWAAGLTFLGLMALAEREPGRPQMIAAIFFVLLGNWLINIPGIALHEAGHALASLLVGARLHTVQVGGGQRGLRLDIGDTRLELLDVMSGGGFVYRYFEGRCPRPWQAVTILAAGGLMNLALALGFTLLGLNLAPNPHTWGWGLISLGAAFSQYRRVYFNLWPWAPRFSKAPGFRTDGEQIWAIFKQGVDPAAERYVEHYCQAEALTRRGRFAEAAAHFRKAWEAEPANGAHACSWLDRLAKAEGHAAAVQAGLAAGLGDPEAPRLEDSNWATTEINIAWSAVQSGDPALLPLADRLSLTVSEAFPEASEIRGTRGAVLVTMGETVAGEILLRAAARATANPVDKAEFCDWLARAQTALGAPALAEDYGRLAVRLRAG